MTKLEAIQQMKAGQKLTHSNFTPEEWVKSNQRGTVYFFEDGVELPMEEFWRWRTSASWDNDWSIFN